MVWLAFFLSVCQVCSRVYADPFCPAKAFLFAFLGAEVHVSSVYENVIM